MSEPKRVSFCLVPFVSLYKKRAKMATPVLTATAPPSYSCCSGVSGVEEPQRNEIVASSGGGGSSGSSSNGGGEVKPLIAISAVPAPLVFAPPPPLNLSIRAPAPQQDLHVAEVPAYDTSPMSPATLASLKEMRAHEEELRKGALTEALSGFHEQTTPLHHRTPASSVLGSSSGGGGAMSPLVI